MCGWQFGLLCGLAGPALSSALCGMPPVSILPSMMIELAVYGLIAGIMMRCVRTRHVYADLYISLIVAIVAGRVVNGLVNALIFARGSYSMATWVAGSVVKSWPGTVIQLVFIPSIVFALMKARLIPERYPKRCLPMIERSDVISFFDRCAPDWDAEMIRNEPVIRTILDNADIRAGVDVLDVACGTGVLFPDYLARDVHSVTGVDIAPEMARRAAEKFPDARVTVLCGDIETVPLPQQFDRCMVYNAFPHFPDPARLIAHLATLLKPGGRLSVAHGMSRAMLDRHHAGAASTVSVSLISETELAARMAPYFDVDVVISDDRMYQVCGTKK
ncbi:MAG: ECF transporter S component [Oscillospiraceae bacterium]